MVTIRTMARTRNSPTPTPTVKIRSQGLMTAFTCPASTERSGSATVMSTPRKKQTQTSTPIRRDLVRPSPTWRPIGLIARSAPRLKSPIPAANRRAQARKTVRSSHVSGARGVNETKRTIPATGTTDMNASQSLDSNAFFM